MTFHAYLLRCSDGSYYAGHTDDLELRLAKHQSGAIDGYTATRLPIELVWSDAFADRDGALEAERKIKGWSRAKKEALIAGDWDRLRALASRSVLRDEASTGSASPQDERIGARLNPKPAHPESRTPFQPAHPEEGLSASEGPSRRTTLKPPLIILVRPQLGENIGKAARAMLNFGLTELRLVAPRDGWPNPAAGPAASGADQVIEHASVYPDIAGATADCAHVYATTVRRRGLVKPVVTPAQAAAQIRDQPGRSAILFGPERSGLATDDLAVARTVLTVPINPDFGSLNLAQAVVIVAYEWSKHAALAQPTDVGVDPPAPQAELDGLVDHAERLLTPRDYFLPADRAPTNRRTLRSVLTKPGWSSNEVRTMRGVLSCLMRRPS